MHARSHLSVRQRRLGTADQVPGAPAPGQPNESTAAELLRLAEAERSQSLDHFQFTRLIAAEYDLRQKMVLAEVMWGVIQADGRLSDHEAHLVRKMASLSSTLRTWHKLGARLLLGRCETRPGDLG